MKGKQKIVKEIEHTEVNYDTGEEITSSKTREILHSTEPDFVKLYLDCISIFANYPKSLNPILLEILKHMSYAIDDKTGGQLVVLSSYIKNTIAQNCGVTVDRVNQAITNFKKSGCLIPVGRATYGINANYFGRGNWRTIEKTREIQANLYLSKNKREFSVNFSIGESSDVGEIETESKPQEEQKKSSREARESVVERAVRKRENAKTKKEGTK